MNNNKNNNGNIIKDILDLIACIIFAVLLCIGIYYKVKENKEECKEILKDIEDHQQILNCKHEIALIDGHYLLFDENNNITVYIKKDDALEERYIGKAEIKYLKDDESPYILETLYYNDSKNLNKLNDNKMLYIDDEEFCIDEDHYNYSIYTVYIPEE